MRVIFLKDVPNVAIAGDIKDVASGYARNFLIPKKLALLANTSSTTLLETQKRIKANREAQTHTEMLELAERLEGKEVVLKARAGADERLHGSITNSDIADVLHNTDNIILDKRKIELDEPIRQLGSHEVTVRLASDITPRIIVTVVEEETEQQDE